MPPRGGSQPQRAQWNGFYDLTPTSHRRRWNLPRRPYGGHKHLFCPGLLQCALSRASGFGTNARRTPILVGHFRWPLCLLFSTWISFKVCREMGVWCFRGNITISERLIELRLSTNHLLGFPLLESSVCWTVGFILCLEFMFGDVIFCVIFT